MLNLFHGVTGLYDVGCRHAANTPEDNKPRNFLGK